MCWILTKGTHDSKSVMMLAFFSSPTLKSLLLQDCLRHSSISMCCIVAGTAVYHLIKCGIIYFQSLATVFAITPGEKHSNCIVHSADERTIDFIIWPHRIINLPPTSVSICIYLTVYALISYPEVLHSQSPLGQNEKCLCFVSLTLGS